jgi:hypothetical protein
LSFGRVWFWVAASTAAVAVVLAVLAARDRPSPTAKVVSVVAPSPAPTEPDSASRETAAAPPAPRPESLAGTEPDGALVVDAAGVFVATPAAEVRFAFSNASDRPNAMPGTAAVEDAMSEAWIAFARTGDPDHPGIPEWPLYDVRTRPTMVFDVQSRVVNDLRPTERAVHDRVGLRR